MTLERVDVVRVLVVEDNPVDADLVRMALDHETAWSPDTVVAEDGEKAIALLRKHAASAADRPDFILLDLNVPKRDGTEVLHMIRTTKALASIPVAVLSSSPQDVIQKKLTAAGVTADGHFTKPIQLDQFLGLGKVLRAWFKQQKQH